MKKLFIIFLFSLLVGCGNKTDSFNNQEQNLDNIDPKTVVEFKDETFEEMIRDIVLKVEGDIYAEDMEMVYDVSLKNLPEIDITGLEYAKNLTSFSADKTNIKSLKPLKNLQNLDRLTIRYLELDDPILEFSSNVNLSYVLLIETNISDISFLDGMTNMTSVNVSRSDVTDISSLEKLVNLESVSFPNNDITDVSVLKGKIKLQNLNLQGNENLVDIEPLKDLKSLYYLTLSYTGVVNLKPLESLSALEELRIYKNHDVKHLIFDQVSLFENKGVDVYYHK